MWVSNIQIKGSNAGGDEDSNRSSNAMTEAEAMASHLPLTQIGAIPLEDIIGDIPESKCLQMFNKWDNQTVHHIYYLITGFPVIKFRFNCGEHCLTDDCEVKSKEHHHCKTCPFYSCDLNELLEHAK